MLRKRIFPFNDVVVLEVKYVGPTSMRLTSPEILSTDTDRKIFTESKSIIYHRRDYIDNNDREKLLETNMDVTLNMVGEIRSIGSVDASITLIPTKHVTAKTYPKNKLLEIAAFQRSLIYKSSHPGPSGIHRYSEANVPFNISHFISK
uniref:Protein kinase domain-containing protein n=1 Tax=Strongyloides venezuelensis TaxID=75913 RepID=A0A0K0EVD1_STRVS